MKLRIALLMLTVVVWAWSCSDESDIPVIVTQHQLNIVGEIDAEVIEEEGEGEHDHGLRTTSFTETFESASKTSYAASSVVLASGSWYLSDALLGTSTSDRKYNSKSVRVRNTGYATMSFNMDNGATTVSVRHAKYGSDGNSTWRLMASYDNGSSWYYVGNEITTSSTSLNTVTYTINTTQAVRFGVQKLTGGSNRINVDNIEVQAGTSSGGGSGTAARDSNITFGNPSDASTSNSNNYLVSRTDYVLSYNNSKGTANWVSWHMSSAWSGSAARCDCFKQDTSLPSSFFRATTSNYTNSGFDRGHLCPSADRTYSSTANSNTFYMTNIAPQAPKNNQQTWKYFEDYCRELTDAGNELHIIAGVAGQGGTGSNGSANTISSGNITVPDSFWKVILVLPNGTNDVSRVTTATRVIAVNMPNDQTIGTSWGSYRTSVDAIESLTGIDLLENISNSIEATLESSVDNGPTN